MLKNYLNILLRNLIRNKVFSAINIFGMAIGLASCLIISLLIFNELQFDKFHSHHERIYRVVSCPKGPESAPTLAATPSPWAPLLENDYPFVEQSVRLLKDNRSLVGANDDQRFYEENVFFSDASFFSIFDFPLLNGNITKALTEPNTAIITSSIAQKYFGDENPIGKSLLITTAFGPELTVTITGVSTDVPAESHFHYNILLSMSTLGDISNLWSYHMFHTYLLLNQPESANQLRIMLPDFAEKYVNHNAEADGQVNIFLQPLTEIHLHSSLTGEIETNGDATYVYALGGVALFILVLACFNFMNLSTVKSLARSKEVGLRKTVGANQGQLIRQFLGEAILLTFLAAIAALGITQLILPAFNFLFHKNLSILAFASPATITIVIGFLLFVGSATGIYPALVLSSFKPVDVLKGKMLMTLSGTTLRKTLVTFQFVVSIALVVCTLTLHQQLDFLKNKDLGFNQSQVMILTIPKGIADSKIAEFENTLKNKTSVISAAASSSIPSSQIPVNLVRQEGSVNSESTSLEMLFADHSFIETMGMELIAGRNFSDESVNDEKEAFILNEEAVKSFGWSPKEAIDKKFEWLLPNSTLKSGKIIGVIKDVNFRPLNFKVRPLVIHMQPERLAYLYVRLQPGRLEEYVKMLEAEFKYFFSSQPFEFTFLDQTIQHLYDNEQTLGRIFTYATSLAIIIALLGVFALSTYSAKQRTKEIAIRKILGAATADIFKSSTKGFISLVLVANLFALPGAWYLMNKWLSGYAYRISVDWSILATSTLFILIVAILTVSFESIKAAIANPVDSLRNE